MALRLLFAAFVFLQIALASHGHNHHIHKARLEAVEEKIEILKERGSWIVTSGVKGTVSPRLEIRDLAKNADQWNLYLLAMQRFQQMDQSDPLSYYQIAGIHGVPYKTWNSLPMVHQNGMAAHVTTLFLTWHRMYLAMFEQCWYSNVQAVVNSFPAGAERTRWQTAANTLRLPYWDWAKAPPSGEKTAPTLFRDQEVTVTTPTGQQSINNPLYQYTFHPVSNDLGGSPYNTWPSTFRRPVSNPWRSNNNEFAAVMDSSRISLRDRLYNIFVSGATYMQVSTEATGANTGNPSSHDSIEGIHDNVHIISGGPSGGHMYYLDLSAFDPLFWLHHCNVDRQMAMYQVVQPNYWVGNGIITQDNWQWSAGEPKNSYTPLKPFTKNSNGDYYTSNDIRSTSVLGYVYPETVSGATTTSVMAAVNSLYGPNASSKKRDTSYSYNSTGVYEGRPYVKGDHVYILNINAQKHALGGSYSIYAFLGNVSSDYTTWDSSPYLVGTNGITGMTGMSNASIVEIEGAIPLTTAMQGKVEYGEIKSMAPEHVSAYLKKHLSYKVVAAGGKVVSPDQVPGLHLTVTTCPIEPAASSNEFPSWVGDMVTLTNVTSDMPAGTPWTPTGVSPYSNSTMPFGGNPSLESGYCEVQQTIEYVDAEGNFLYSEKK